MDNCGKKLQEAWTEADYANAIIGVCGQDFEKLRTGLSALSTQALKKLYTAIKGGTASEEDATPEPAEISSGKEMVQRHSTKSTKSKEDDVDDEKPAKKDESRVVSAILGRCLKS